MIPSCNLILHKCNPVIPKGHIKYNACRGTGIMIRSFHYRSKYISCYPCPTCHGMGYNDWVTSAMKVDKIKAYNNMRYKLAMSLNKQWGFIHIPFRCPANKKCKVMRTIVKKYNRFLNKNKI